jgi:hypothetical protein
MDRISLELLSTNAGLWIALVPVFIAVAIWVYYRTAAPLERPTRTVLRLLRGLAFLLVLFVLAEPVLTLILPEPGKPGLAVLVDDSASMRTHRSATDSASRADEAASLAKRIDAELSRHFRLDWFRFDTELIPADEPPVPEMTGNTALGGALEAIAARQGSRPVGGVLLISDGVNTVGADPVGEARNTGIPIYPIHVGGDQAPAEVKILQVRSNPIAFAGEPTPIEVELASTGMAGEAVEVRIEDQGRVLASEKLTLGAGVGVERAVRLDVRPRIPGRRRYEVRLVGVEDPVPQNDQRSVAVQVQERKTRVLVLEGRLDWDHTFLRRTLSADSTFAYRFLISDRSGRWVPASARGAPPDGPGNLNDYAAVILGELPEGALDARFYANLARYVERGGGLLVLGGREGIARLRTGSLARLLPAEVSSRAPSQRALPVRVEVAGLTHPVTSLRDRPAHTERIWSSLPPIWPSPDRLRPKPQSSVLLSFVDASGDEPALVVGFAGEGKAALLAAHDFWRWEFLVRGAATEAADAFGDFTLRIVRWLAEPTVRDRFLAEPVRGVFQNGEAPEFQARVWDDSYQPVSDARIELRVVPADSNLAALGAETIELRPRGFEGNYAGRSQPLAPGGYRFIAEAFGAEDARPLGRVESSFWVDENGPEFLRLNPDRGTLEQIARASGGKATDAAGIGEIIAKLPDVVRKTGRIREIELWNHLALFIAFVVVLSIEWFLRRRRGMV